PNGRRTRDRPPPGSGGACAERMDADGNHQDRGSLYAGERPRHSLAADGRADRPHAGSNRRRRESSGRRHGDRHRGGRARCARRTHSFAGGEFLCHQPPLKRANYDPTGSFEPVCYLAATPMVLVVLGSSPYRTLDDLIAAARAKPGELAFASGGPGSSLHVAIEVLKRAANINLTYVPYGGTAPAINA